MRSTIAIPVTVHPTPDALHRCRHPEIHLDAAAAQEAS